MSSDYCDDPVWRLALFSAIGLVLANEAGGCVGAWGDSSLGNLRHVTQPICRAVDRESPSWMLEPVPPVGVLWSVQPLAMFPLLHFAPGLLPRSWGLLMSVWRLLLVFQLGCTHVPRLPIPILTTSDRRWIPRGGVWSWCAFVPGRRIP